MGGRLIPCRDEGRANIEIWGIWRRGNVTMSGKTSEYGKDGRPTAGKSWDEDQ